MALVLLGACSQIPDQVRHPEPLTPLLRVHGPSCDSSGQCNDKAVIHVGSLVFAEGDSLVLADRMTGRHTVVRPDSLAFEIYRGQRVTAGGVLKQTGKNTVFGLAVGTMSALVGAGIGKLVGFEFDAGEMVKAGAISGAMGGVVQGAVQGASEGDAVWERITVLQLRQELCRCSHP